MLAVRQLGPSKGWYSDPSIYQLGGVYFEFQGVLSWFEGGCLVKIKP